ncbi:MAG: neutral/alkaline non-lysosomal ceramidase N-terminal domain-containing protein [Saprospiraceae bacterium]|nr:neutral/alkaline non-lysosomal ceramidase N-terminal domain-containing protein [Saprospiraceae bacterium]MBP8940550.1 neutral/alkaline non-lysosomal ceramidase N-terminal domain-containing protein [Saprospiraceae bacterium]MBP9744772.1 neutral/alkaline non-lysosomal ceramidase N-terminal domain-containing protein [Saprospiraceae bacterium]
MKLPLVLILLIGFDLIMSTTSSGQKISGLSTVNSFRAAVVKKNISPSSPKQLLGYGARLSTGIHDSIYHRIIVLDDGSTQFFLISTEVCLMSPSEYDHVAGILQKKLGIQPVNFWWSVTHTHSAPEVGVPGLAEAFMGDRYKHPVDTAYTDFIEKSLIEGIQEARQKLEPARLGVGWGYSQANINRRAIDVDGRASLGLNPDGPVDRRIGLLRLEKADRSPLALIVNYPIHGTVLGQENVEISGDVTGMVANYVEHQTGVPVLFINGAAGNLAPIYSVYPNPRAGHLSQFRVLLGDKILEANNKLAVTSDSIKLFTGALTVEGPRKAQLGWPAYLDAYSHSGQNGNNTVKLPIRFLRINEEVAIWSAPLELFCEISNEIRDRSPFPYTFYYGYTNGWLGYLPTENEWKHGGYEVEVVSPFTPSMGKILTESVLGYLHGEMRR